MLREEIQSYNCFIIILFVKQRGFTRQGTDTFWPRILAAQRSHWVHGRPGAESKLMLKRLVSKGISQELFAQISSAYLPIRSSGSGSVFGTLARMALMSTSLPRAARSFRYRSASKADSFSAKALLTSWFTETPSVCARRFACWWMEF